MRPRTPGPQSARRVRRALGHEGVDFALPEQTAVRAVHEGKVVWTGNATDFGPSVLLEHPWGQSLYADLAEVHVRAGEEVDAAQQVGLSGGASGETAAHFHFGMRVIPYSGGDGWYGYSDPLPYLARVQRPRGSILGPHILGGVHRHFPLLEKWQPRLIVVVDPNPDEMRELRRICPDATIVGRVYVPDGEVSDRMQADSRAAARWAHERVMAHLSPHVDFWQVANEVHQATSDLPLLNDFEMVRMGLAEAAGYRCALFGFAVGNPDLPSDERMGAWKLLYPALARAEQRGHCVSVHQYAAPDLTTPTIDWHIHRLEHQVLRRIPYKKLQFAVTEFGLDGLLQGPDPAGWRSLSTAQAYVDGLLRAGRYLERFSGRVLGYAVYSLGVTGPWASYNIDGEVAAMLADRSERGTWAQVNTESGGLDAAESDQLEGPGGTEATPPPSTPETPSPVLERRVSQWIASYNMAIKAIAERRRRSARQSMASSSSSRMSSPPSTAPGSPRMSGAAFRSGRATATCAPTFRRPVRTTMPLAQCWDLTASLWRRKACATGRTVSRSLGNPDYEGFVEVAVQEKSHWANLVLFGGSSFVPERGESGPWCWMPRGRAEVMTGAACLPNITSPPSLSGRRCRRTLPTSRRRSIHLPFSRRQLSHRRFSLPVEPPPVEPPPVPPPVQPPVTPPDVERRTGSWIEYLKCTVKGIAERPDKPSANVAYVIKDIFTTCDGSWEPADKMGSVDQWARDAYLKPWGAPDYFDDAGADHHIFGCVLGLDGKPLPDFEVRYWSDGFEQLGNPDYQGYVQRRTKTQSGWANIPMDGGANYFPESGQQGPWCWTPAGAADVFCGGGMPSNHHVSFFVVWQAVEQIVNPPLPGDQKVFLPWVAGPSQELPMPPVIAPEEGGPAAPTAPEHPAAPPQLRHPQLRRRQRITRCCARCARMPGCV